jgi:hypothetical protein
MFWSSISFFYRLCHCNCWKNVCMFEKHMFVLGLGVGGYQLTYCINRIMGCPDKPCIFEIRDLAGQPAVLSYNAVSMRTPPLSWTSHPPPLLHFSPLPLLILPFNTNTCGLRITVYYHAKKNPHPPFPWLPCLWYWCSFRFLFVQACWRKTFWACRTCQIDAIGGFRS